MTKKENSKNNIGVVIIIIIIFLLLSFGLWYYLINNKEVKGQTDSTSQDNNDQVTTNVNKEYNYKDGILTRIVDEKAEPLQNDFVINGIILVGNRHNYEGLEEGSEGILQKLVSKGYKKEGINSSFYLNEYIEFYIDTTYTGEDKNVNIYITPHKTVEEYQKMTSQELYNLASEKGAIVGYQTPEKDNYKYVGENYVSMDYKEGKYDVLFVYKDKLAYFININLTKEPTE